MISKEIQNTRLIYARSVKKSWVLLFRSLFIIATLFVIYESLVPSNSATVPGRFDKIMHFAAYFTLVYFAALAYPKARLLHIVGAMILLGAALEGTQGFMSVGRTASFGDFLANLLGACTAAISWIGCIKMLLSRYR